MNCPEVQERLTDYVVDEATPADGGAIEGHVAGCPACAGALAELRGAIDLVRESDWKAGAPALTPERRSALEERAAEPKPRRSSFIQYAALAAGLAALGLGVATLTMPLLLRARMAVPKDELPRVADSFVIAPSSAPPPGPHGAAMASKPIRDQALARKSRGYLDGSDMSVAGRVVGGAPGGVVGGVVGGRPAEGPAIMSSDRFSRGLRLPNGALARDMYFEHQGTNPFVETREDPLSTFGLDVDTASYTVTRNYLLRGAMPPPAAVRTEEFVNAFPQDYAPEPGRAFVIHLEGAPSPLHPGYHLLRIGLRARDVAARDRKPAVLTFVIDVSGSMAMENRLGLVKRSLRLLVERLDERDRIGIVVYGTNGRVVLEPTPVSESREILDAIDALASVGSTNLEQGLDLGYRMAAQALDTRATNRVVLCTDGVANNGVTDAETLLRRIRRYADQGIAMTALGFGMGNYNDVLLQKLADRGDGQYAYIDDLLEAKSFFLRDLTAVLEVVARDAKAQVDFDPGRVERYRLLGYEKRDVADEDFRNDQVDGGELNAGHAVTALYEVKLSGAGPFGTVRVRYKDPDTREGTEVDRVIDGSVFRERFEDASPRFRLAVVAARFAEHLRKSYWVKGEGLDAVLKLAEALPAGLRQDPQVAELEQLIRQAQALSERERRR